MSLDKRKGGGGVGRKTGRRCDDVGGLRRGVQVGEAASARRNWRGGEGWTLDARGQER